MLSGRNPRYFMLSCYRRIRFSLCFSLQIQNNVKYNFLINEMKNFVFSILFIFLTCISLSLYKRSCSLNTINNRLVRLKLCSISRPNKNRYAIMAVTDNINSSVVTLKHWFINNYNAFLSRNSLFGIFNSFLDTYYSYISNLVDSIT